MTQLITDVTLRQIEKLENSIVASDPYGEDLLISDLRKQIFVLTAALRKSCGYAKRKVDVTPRFKSSKQITEEGTPGQAPEEKCLHGLDHEYRYTPGSKITLKQCIFCRKEVPRF